MIDEKTKSIALAKLSYNYAIEEVAEELEVPVKIVEDWAMSLNSKQLIKQQADIVAVEKVVNGTVVQPDEEVLKSTLEETALDLARQASSPGMTGDMAVAKSIELCANAVTKLYSTIILKNGSGVIDVTPSQNGGLSAFRAGMKD